MRKNVIAILGILLCFARSEAIGAIQYTVTDLGGGFAYGINDNGQITGRAHGHAFLYSNGVMTDLGTLGGESSTGYGINNSGQIVGWSKTITDGDHIFLYSNGITDLGTGFGHGINDSGQVTGYANNHAFLYSNGAMTDLGTLGGSYGVGFAINNSGQITGQSSDAYSNYRAFLCSGEIMTRIGGDDSYGFAINDAGQVAGSFINAAGNDHAFLYSNGVMIDLGALDPPYYSYGYGINNSGQVVGESHGHAFLYSDDVMTDLNTLIDSASGWTLIEGRDINNLGQIVGYGINPDGYEHAFLLTPIPEPATIILFGLAAALLWRRKP
jgi:probable HAF family extracellular repeat protein